MTVRVHCVLGFVLGAIAGACTVENADHCANQDGHRTCADAYPGEAEYCSTCAAERNGCVAQVDPECLPDSGSGTDTAADATETATSSTTGTSTGASDSTGPTCGDGIIDPDLDEACDGMDLGGLTCQSLGYTGGELACRPDCRLDPTGCEGFDDCDNGVIDPGEECDTPALGGVTCASMPQYSGGTLQCDDQCRFNTTQCEACYELMAPCDADEQCCEDLICDQVLGCIIG